MKTRDALYVITLHKKSHLQHILLHMIVNLNLVNVIRIAD